jgi:hypothetical protein
MEENATATLGTIETNETKTRATLEEMHDLVQQHIKSETFDVARGRVLVTQPNLQVHDLEAIAEKHNPTPKRPKGTSKHDMLESIILHATRHKNSDSVAFCALGSDAPKIVVVYDYTPAAGDVGGWREHRAEYNFPVSDEWKRWRAASQTMLDVGAFAELLEVGISDVRDTTGAEDRVPRLMGVTYATPAELLTLARGLAVRVEMRVADQRKRDDGTSTISFSEEHTNEKGEPLRIPNGFLLGIPVFAGGPSYAIPVRLRYRIANGKVLWSVGLHDAAAAMREAVTEAANRFASETGLPVFYGQAE